MTIGCEKYVAERTPGAGKATGEYDAVQLQNEHPRIYRLIDIILKDKKEKQNALSLLHIVANEYFISDEQVLLTATLSVWPVIWQPSADNLSPSETDRINKDIVLQLQEHMQRCNCNYQNDFTQQIAANLANLRMLSQHYQARGAQAAEWLVNRVNSATNISPSEFKNIKEETLNRFVHTNGEAGYLTLNSLLKFVAGEIGHTIVTDPKQPELETQSAGTAVLISMLARATHTHRQLKSASITMNQVEKYAFASNCELLYLVIARIYNLFPAIKELSEVFPITFMPKYWRNFTTAINSLSQIENVRGNRKRNLLDIQLLMNVLKLREEITKIIAEHDLTEQVKFVTAAELEARKLATVQKLAKGEQVSANDILQPWEICIVPDIKNKGSIFWKWVGDMAKNKVSPKKLGLSSNTDLVAAFANNNAGELWINYLLKNTDISRATIVVGSGIARIIAQQEDFIENYIIHTDAVNNSTSANNQNSWPHRNNYDTYRNTPSSDESNEWRVKPQASDNGEVKFEHHLVLLLNKWMTKGEFETTNLPFEVHTESADQWIVNQLTTDLHLFYKLRAMISSDISQDEKDKMLTNYYLAYLTIMKLVLGEQP